VAASHLVGCGAKTIEKAVRGGRIIQREVTSTAAPSLDRASVLEFGEAWAAQKRAQAERAARRGRRSGPPEDGNVWLDTSTSALVLGVSGSLVWQLARQGRLPGIVHYGRRWFRREHVEQAAAARALSRLS
jgi:hypothetical protein